MDVKAERVNPYRGDTRCKTEQVRDMFDSIAPAYDFMNRMMTFGIDRLWRRKAVRMLASGPHADILDVATGTGDLALLLARSLRPATVTGIDLSEGMLEVARRKASADTGAAASGTKMTFLAADCLHLPMPDATYDIVTAAYGVRNFEHLDTGYREMYRVLQPGAVLCVIELSTPTSPIVKPLYNFYTRRIIPTIGRLVSHDVRAYSYLPESIAAVPQGNAMLELLREAGFSQCTFTPLTFGTCTIYMAIK